MLPFLKPKKSQSVVIASAKPEGGLEPEHDEGEHDPMLLGIAEDLIQAIHAKDPHAVADALQAADHAMDMGVPADDQGEM